LVRENRELSRIESGVVDISELLVVEEKEEEGREEYMDGFRLIRGKR
jgi:hypothetical protein